MQTATSPFTIGEQSKTVRLYKSLIGSPTLDGEWTRSDEDLYLTYMSRQEWEVFYIAFHTEGMPGNWLVL